MSRFSSIIGRDNISRDSPAVKDSVVKMLKSVAVLVSVNTKSMVAVVDA